jgi:hypothetical protein
VRPAQLTGLPCSLAPLIIHEAFEVRLELVVHFNSSCLDFVRADEWEVRLPIVASVTTCISFLLIGADVKVCFLHIMHLLDLGLFLPFNVLFFKHCQLFEEFLFLLLTHLSLICVLGQLVSYLF